MASRALSFVLCLSLGFFVFPARAAELPPTVQAAIAKHKIDKDRFYTKPKDFFGTLHCFHGVGGEEALRRILLEGVKESAYGDHGRGLYVVSDSQIRLVEEMYAGTHFDGKGMIVEMSVHPDARLVDISENSYASQVYARLEKAEPGLTKDEFCERFGIQMLAADHEPSGVEVVVKDLTVLGKPVDTRNRTAMPVEKIVSEAKEIKTAETWVPFAKKLTMLGLSAKEMETVLKAVPYLKPPDDPKKFRDFLVAMGKGHGALQESEHHRHFVEQQMQRAVELGPELSVDDWFPKELPYAKLSSSESTKSFEAFLRRNPAASDVIVALQRLTPSGAVRQKALQEVLAKPTSATVIVGAALLLNSGKTLSAEQKQWIKGALTQVEGRKLTPEDWRQLQKVHDTFIGPNFEIDTVLDHFDVMEDPWMIISDLDKFKKANRGDPEALKDLANALLATKRAEDHVAEFFDLPLRDGSEKDLKRARQRLLSELKDFLDLQRRYKAGETISPHDLSDLCRKYLRPMGA